MLTPRTVRDRRTTTCSDSSPAGCRPSAGTPARAAPASVGVDLLAELSDVRSSCGWPASTYGDDGTELYQVPLVAHREPVDYLEHVLLGTIDTDDGHDAGSTTPCTTRTSPRSGSTSIRDERADGAAALHPLRRRRTSIPVGQPSLVLTGEQSNTSLMYGDVAILKVFRRLQPGVNPDIEIGMRRSASTARGTSPRLLGAVDGRPRRRAATRSRCCRSS